MLSMDVKTDVIVAADSKARERIPKEPRAGVGRFAQNRPS
jgi:hypothetical protein